MKNLTILSALIFALGSVQANELIFKSDFAATALVSGTASGINNDGLKLELTVNGNIETLDINSNGRFVFFMPVAIGDNWSVSMIQLPENPQQQSCAISDTNGTMPPTGAETLQVACDNNPWNWDQMNWDEGGWG